jgi:preprotein translocase subunit SecF
MHIDQVVDDAVNQTLSRSINTTLTTLLTLTFNLPVWRRNPQVFCLGADCGLYRRCLFQYFYCQFAASLVAKSQAQSSIIANEKVPAQSRR